MKWYRRNGRDLPWRRHPTPYRIWISEILLQQTQVATVIPYYERFITRFPDLESLAAASEREVLALWSGLGYYKRAQNILRAARNIVRADGVFPRDFEKILALPGVGRYTAGAICCIAYNQPHPAVDGNIRRIVARLEGKRGHAPESYFYRRMEDWIPQENASAFLQAMMDLGSTICVPLRPDCPRCPAADVCEARKLGIQRSIPAPRKKKPSGNFRIVVLVLERRGRTLLTELGGDCFIPGNWGLPFRMLSGKQKPEEIAALRCREIFGRAVTPRFYGRIHHGISNRRITGYVYGCAASRPLSPLRDSRKSCWAPPHLRSTLLTSSLFHKALKIAGIAREALQ